MPKKPKKSSWKRGFLDRVFKDKLEFPKQMEWRGKVYYSEFIVASTGVDFGFFKWEKNSLKGCWELTELLGEPPSKQHSLEDWPKSCHSTS